MNRFDLSILHFINRFAHRSPIFDEFIVLVSTNNFLKGALVVAVIWWLWFKDGEIRRKRESLIAGVGAAFVGLAVARISSWIIVRPRPLTVPQLLTRIPYHIKAVEWEGWSSFPSDHAVLFFALATGIFFASRRIGWLMFIYVSAFICLPRVYIGVHYPTDILAGAAIGVSLGWLANLSTTRKVLTGWALRWLDSRPGQFYSFSFLLTYQICELFDPANRIVNFMLRRHLPP